MTSEPTADSLAAGQTLNNRYRLERRLGSGGMGQVFLATDLTSSETVALKCLHGGQDSTDRRRFEREIRTLQTLDHTNIVPFRDLGWEGDLLFYTMDYYTSVTLEDVIAARGRVTETEELDWYLRVTMQVVEALKYIHGRRLVHRDVKPANILLRVPGLGGELPPAEDWVEFTNVIACLSDFGLVKSRDSDGSLTQTSLGTPQYMSPEQIESSPAVDERSDLYALGVMLYRIATGQLPFERLSEVLSRTAATPIRQTNPELPMMLESVTAKLLEFEAYKRPASSDEVLKMLQAVLRRKTLQAVDQHVMTKMAQPAFSGRTVELKSLKRAAKNAARGMGSWVSITGERGTGKTWLVHRSDLKSHALVANQLTFYTGRFTRARSHSAYQELLEGVLRHVERHHGRERAAELLGSWGRHLKALIPLLNVDDLIDLCPPAEDIPAEFLKERLIDALVDILCTSAEIEPRILVLEDLHYGNEFDIEVLRRLVMSAIQLPVLIVTTHRPDFESRMTALERQLHETRTIDRLVEIEMKAFAAVEVRQMLESMLVPARSASQEFVDVLVERTDGVPLYVLHLINSLWKRSSIRAAAGQWEVDTAQVRSLPIPESTRSHFLLMLEEIPAQELKVLNLAAVIGVQFAFDVLLDVSGMDEFELDALCRNLVHAGLLEERQDGFRFLHTFEQEILFSRLSKPMRRRLHARVGKSLERLYEDDLERHVGQIAEHLYHGGDQQAGLEYLLRAAANADQAYAPREALNYYSKALEFTQERGQRRSLLITIGELEHRLGNPEDAYRSFMESMQLFTAVENLLLKSEAYSAEESGQLKAYADLLMKFGDFYGKRGELEPALKNYEKSGSIAAKIDDKNGIAYAMVRKGATLQLREKLPQAEEAYLSAVQLYQDLRPCAGLVAALNGLSRVAVFKSDSDRGLEYANRALAIAEEIGDRARSAAVLGTIGTIQRRRGNYNAAVRSFEQAVDILTRLGDRRGLAMTYGNLGVLEMTRGDFRKSFECFDQARELFQILGDRVNVVQTVGNMGSLQFCLGNFDEARRWQAEYYSAAEARNQQRFVADAQVLHGLIDLECGLYEDAERHFREGLRVFDESDNQSEAGMPKVYLARVYGRQGRPDDAERMCCEVLASFQDSTIPNESVAEAMRVRAEARLAAGDPENAETFATQALELYEKLSLPYHEGICCRTIGKIYRELGYYWADQTGKYFERAMRSFEQLGARHALALTQLEYGIFLGLMDEVDRARELFEAAESMFVELALKHELDRVRRELKEMNR